jgi:hypothetical protein
MEQWRTILAVALAANLVSGCGAVQWLDKNANFAVAADPLDATLVENALSHSNTSDDAKANVARVAFDSEQKCSEFLSNLIVNETGSNAFLDIGTTAATAAATAVSGPLSAIHALSAIGAFTSGTKTAIDSDFFAKASVSNYAQAIQSTYFTQMGVYLKSLEAVTPPPLGQINSWTSTELGKIEAFHAECGIGPAQTAVSATLAMAGQQAGTPNATATLVISAASGTAALAPAQMTLTATSSTSTIPITVSISKGETVANIATAVVTNVTQTAKTAGWNIVAAIANDGSITLTSNASDSVQWANPVVTDVTAVKSGISATLSAVAAPSPSKVMAPGAALAPPPPAAQTPTANVGAPIQSQ